MQTTPISRRKVSSKIIACKRINARLRIAGTAFQGAHAENNHRQYLNGEAGTGSKRYHLDRRLLAA